MQIFVSNVNGETGTVMKQWGSALFLNQKIHQLIPIHAQTMNIDKLFFFSTRFTIDVVATGQEMVREKKFFKVREMSGNFILGQGKLSFEEKSGKIEILRLI